MDSGGKTRLIASTLSSDSGSGDFQTPEIDKSEIRVGEKIGSGSFGVVYKGTVRGKTVAIKQLHSQAVDEEVLEDFRKEIKIMVHLRHPNVVLFMGACTEPGHLSIVTEFLPSGSLHDLLHKPKIHISLLQKLKMMQDLALGMNWLHCSKPPILHRDLKSTNVLVDEHWNMKLCDFGLSTIFDRGVAVKDEGNPCGTPIFMSPEVLEGKALNQKADVYAFALVCWEILTRKDPFDHHTSWEKFKYAVCEDKERPVIPDGTHTALAQLLQKCWHENPEERPSFENILKALEEVTLQISFPDTPTREFWRRLCVREKKYDLHRLPFASFANHLWQELKLPAPNPKTATYKCMHALLAERLPHDEVEMISMQRLSHFCYWFGSLFQERPADSIVDKVQMICNEPWFHGDISKEESEKLITGKKHYFLVRLSLTDPHTTPFTISKTDSEGKISHQRIYSRDSGSQYYIVAKPNEVAASSLASLIKAIKKSLGKPIESARFRAFFLAEPQNGGYQDDDE